LFSGELTSIGSPEIDRVLVEAQAGPCPHCNVEFLDYDVLIERNVIRDIRPHNASIDFDTLAEPYLDLGSS